MRRIWLSPYELVVRSSGERRLGYLIRLQAPEFEAGYADIFPWVGLGDPAWSEIPDLLKTSAYEAFPLLQRSLEMAEVDGRARMAKRSLLGSLRLRNHFLVTDIDQARGENFESLLNQGFTHLKIKMNPFSFEDQMIFLRERSKEGWKLRLDWNGGATPVQMDRLGELATSIDFIEDPFTESSLWGSYSSLCYDQPGFSYDEVGTAGQIHKPARQSLDEIKGKSVVFTSYRDHPVGIAHACYQASLWGSQENDYGMMSFGEYQETPFQSGLLTSGPWLSFKEGFGIGFDDKWETCTWQKVL